MRLFAAVRPPPAVVRSLAAGVEAAVAAHAPDVGERLRRPPLEQWHVTLAFYGDVPENATAELADRLGRDAARTAAFPLAVRGAGAFPRRRAAGVLWLGLDEPPGALRRLADRAAAAGRRSGLAMPDRSWRAHLTVGRSRQPLDATGLVAALDRHIADLVAADPGALRWRVDEVELVESHLGPRLRHEVIGRFPLGD
jgi:2'-5' RNA ligase